MQLSSVDGPDGPPAPRDGDDAGRGRTRRRLLVGGGAVAGLLALLYVVDLLVSATDVPRGVVVGGVEIGGMNRLAADSLRTQVGPRVARPIALVAGSGPDAAATLDPRTAGLDLDVAATIDQAGEQPLNPFTRLASLFSDREVAPVSKGDPVAVGQAIDRVRPQLDRPSVEGTIRFDGARPVPVPPDPGHVVEAAAAPGVVLEHWLDPAPVALPVTGQPVSVTQDGIDTACARWPSPRWPGRPTSSGTVATRR